MQKPESSASSPFSASSNARWNARDPVFWGLIVLATLLLLGSSWRAWEQESHPDAYRTTSGWLSKDFWLYPVEQNAFKRLPSIGTNLNAIHVHADGQRGWATGWNGTILHTMDGGKSWQSQISGVDASLNSITFAADGQRGWATGWNGTILHTMDGGESWQSQISGVDASLNSITFAADGQRGWAVGIDGTVLHTTDGGKSWQSQISGVHASLNSITFAADGQRGWATGWNGTILHTMDGGKSWQSQISGVDASLNSITFAADGQRGWVVGDRGTILYTTDGGKSWREQASGTLEWLTSITFTADGQRGWVVGNRGPILHTIDGGKSWQGQVSGTGESLNSITFAGDGQFGWVVGNRGTILHTTDGGKSWREQASGTLEWLTSITFTTDGQRGWAVGDGGTILHTMDGGKSWKGQYSGIDEGLRSITFAGDGQHGWVVGGNWEGSVILSTEDGGKSWRRQFIGMRQWLTSIIFMEDGQRGWAVGVNLLESKSTILHTVDGGKSWKRQDSGINKGLRSITFVGNGQRGWVVGGGGRIVYTEDGGKSWHKQESGIRESLTSIVFLEDGKRGWAVGDKGMILQTEDGGESWHKQESGINESLTSIVFLEDGKRGWAVGDKGMILHTEDGGKSWHKQESGIHKSLTSIVLLQDGWRGWVVGGNRLEGGTILHTEDGGRSWHADTYHMFPAPWFYLLLFLVFVLYVLAFAWLSWKIRQAGKQAPVRSVSDHAATDRPISLGDPDFLGARRIAVGLTRFLTNDKTEPPLTLAITGDWGSGKSSLMNYLFANLKRQGLRPVWFNAWHHREEQNVLASILAKVHQDAIKPWWHPAGFWFRGRLWWRRHWMWKVLMLISWGFAIFMVSWLFMTLKLDTIKWHEIWRYGVYLAKIEQPVILDENGYYKLCPSGFVAVDPDTQSNLCQKLRFFQTDRRFTHDELDCLTSVTSAQIENTCFVSPEIFLRNVEQRLGGKLLLSEEKAIKDALEYLTPDSSMPFPAPVVAWITALIALLVLLASKGMALLGLSSLQLVQVVLRRAGAVNQVSEKTGTRQLFESYFRHITDLLGKRRLVLFIDDLDRCDRDYTRQVLEVTNFLSSSGALFIVIGMAPRYVLANVTLSFQDTAKAVHEADMRNGKTPPGHDPNAGQSWFAQHYLQKLINIEVPVPKPDAGQVKALLKNEVQSQAQDEDRKLERLEKSEKRIDDALKFFGKLFRFALLLGVTGYAIYLAGWGLDGKTAAPPVKEQMQSSATVSPKATDKAEQTRDLPKERSPDIKDETGGAKGRIFIPAPSRRDSFVTWPLWAGISVVVFVVLLSAVAYLLIRKQDALNDQRWWWLKPLLKRFKVTLFGPEVTQDTKDFTDALDIWYELIARKDPTPRNIKAFKNHLRYLASRDNQTPEYSREAHLVALATLFYVYPKDFDEIPAVMNSVFSDSIFASSRPSHKPWLEAISMMKKHHMVFGEIPSQEDIQFFKSMIQDMHIHRPNES